MALTQNLRTSSSASCSAATQRGLSSRSVRAPVRKSIVFRASAESAAEAQWESQVREGKVSSISGKDVAKAVSDGWVILDVRPESEISKARILGATTVPLFLPDNMFGNPMSFLNGWMFNGMGGWWLGGSHMVVNPNFVKDVMAKVPKDAKIIVGCQKGLRSLSACETLITKGYAPVAWINGGFDSLAKGDVQTEGDIDIRYGGIGGLSSVLGWTVVQQDEKKNLFTSYDVIKVFAGLLVLDGLLFAYEAATGQLGPLPFFK